MLMTEIDVKSQISMKMKIYTNLRIFSIYYLFLG